MICHHSYQETFKMSGAAFLDTLRKLEYPRLDKLNSPLLDRLFASQEASQPFVSWFCKNVNVKHLLKPEELKSFNLMKDSGEKIYDGKQLEDSLKEFSAREAILTSEKEINDDEFEICLKRKELLLQSRAALDQQLSAVSKRMARSQTLIEEAKKKYAAAEQLCQDDNSKMQTSLKHLTESVKNLSAAYIQPPGDACPNFLSQTSLSSYQAAEYKYLDEINCYIKKQFSEAISEISGQGEGDRYELLEVSNPDSLLVRGEKEKVNLSECKELARLQNLYPNSERLLVQTSLDHKILSVSCQYLEKLCSTLREKKDSLTLHTRLIEEAQKLESKQKSLSVKFETDLPLLIKKNAASQVSKILTGDYDMKLARQKYHLSKLDELIQISGQQQSRQEFLTAAYAVEDRRQRDVHHLLTSIQMELAAIKDNWQKRMSMLEDFLTIDERYQRNTVDSHNKFMKLLYESLVATESESHSETQLCVPYSIMIEAAERLKNRKDSALQSLTVSEEKHTKRLKLMEDSIRKCKEVLYNGNEVNPLLDTIPILPAGLHSTTVQLKETLEKLHKELEAILLDYKNKKANHKSDWLQAKERQLFVYFHTNPTQLESAIQEVETRLKVENILQD